jgi:hypothetical protein
VGGIILPNGGHNRLNCILLLVLFLKIAFKLTTFEGIDAHRGEGGRRVSKVQKFFIKMQQNTKKRTP